jgi:putative RNA 2'-phosphotransferase
LTLDEDGWANIDALIAGAASAGRQFNRESIKQIVTNNDKKRFGLSEDGQRIRAVQGHSNQQVFSVFLQT